MQTQYAILNDIFGFKCVHAKVHSMWADMPFPMKVKRDDPEGP